ncbi:DUF6122 family protein [Chryseobacterium sp. HSC-36S06]|uniref:DUF6122 family protein n=1 Tax=Chryseobacterium sp. HSC-36S06 TaxID=2910970 RepID=UPI001A1AE42B|nr:DUF6122 family protein [Chryseobacterium sp. HSC-36S06]MBH1958747.1 hypothetical protein [Flavobacteriia bacterium]MBH2024617.1 hypothetical protein [Flavobacteriales bacterium]MCP2037287.1 hypothetical protein [Chryseobacterium sp. HSC-36S06]
MSEIFYAREIFHYFLHFIFPFFIAKVFFKDHWRKAYLIMIATMAVDIDHIFADPIFDPNRASIGFHPLHTYPAIAVYFLGTVFFKGYYKIASVGLLFHMFTDFQDYYFWQ